MKRLALSCLIAAATIAHAADTFVAQPDGFSPEDPMEGETVIWQPGTPAEVPGLVFGTTAFTSIAAATVETGIGETVFIAPGTYLEGQEIFVPVDMNFQGDGAGRTIVDGGSSHPLFTVGGKNTISDLTIQNGSGGSQAGGISSFGPELTLLNVHFTGNLAGALLVVSPFDPQAPPGGQQPHAVRIEGCLFNDNTGNGEGSPSCILHEGDFDDPALSNVTVTNTTFSSNQDLAIGSLAGKLTLTHCTFYNNQGGAFDATNIEAPGSDVILNNSLVLGTYNVDAAKITSNGTNFLENDSIGSDDRTFANTTASVPEDVIDLNLSDNGGATATHRLSPDSVAIDAGTNADAVDALGRPLAFDQRGKDFPRTNQGTVDIGALENIPSTLTVSIADPSISENGGSSTVTITRNTDPFVNLTVTLSSDDTSEATVPATVNFGPEQTSVTVPLTAVNDDFADDDQFVTITASADGFDDGTDTVIITDDEVPTLTVSISPASISENNGTATVTITRNTDPSFSDFIDLFSDDESEATVPATATFNPGETTTTVTLTAVDDNDVDGTQTVTITASGEIFPDATDTVDVTDDEVAALTVSVDPATISENGGTSAATVTITRNTGFFDNLEVSLSSDDTSEATLPATVSFGPEQSSATVPLAAIDDAIADGTQTVTITASADGFEDGTGTVDVTDDEVATLTVSILAASIPENGGTTDVTLTRNTDPNETLTIDLSSDDDIRSDRSRHCHLQPRGNHHHRHPDSHR